jgi:hypothetical protein
MTILPKSQIEENQQVDKELKELSVPKMVL